MKVIEPLSSALLVTACVYSAGMAQNSSFMGAFGVNPAFSQPAIDKIFYDGGLITFELLLKHLVVFSLIVITMALICPLSILALKIKNKTTFKLSAPPIIDLYSNLISSLVKMSGILTIAYLILLTFLAYDKGRADGLGVAKSFMSTCQQVIIKKGSKDFRGCAFNKDRDSLWYIPMDDSEMQPSSKPLSEIDRIIYLDPIDLN
ncbi:hypothetical protein ACXHIE_004046 [Pseudomonas aeruginosa]|uniref:hypothetical protein n=1 Tax=Pseudomonas aeruginosa TaxID=287 RepID=UPI00053E28E5|nr:hypothetical protein [Pseudomonas aeruginosa]MCC8904638.1 hypothetical protein [Pseudomonas aeruginosa]MCO3369994.1 hypothetical protein [Pseudomonas aeruginosa]MCO3375315.1 hypothetical protein [Pseudomonas aeruginosa]MCO3382198.1 hypothetical protein [Pseudomonas aeruginosa]MCS7566302.1 hypothetical protein [Pseudomonas aeruginosa]